MLSLRGFERTAKTKFVRHEDPKYEMATLMRQGWFEAYQRLQGKPAFHNTDQLVSFVGAGGTRARFVGVFDVAGHRPPTSADFSPPCPYPEWAAWSRYRYELTKRDSFEDLEGRVIIAWGKGTRSWYQWTKKDKPVVEILPAAESVPVFDDYLEFTLTHQELQTIISSPEAHREWRSRLRAVAGVYLILASTSGDLYVGSAHGEEGIWGRWTAYAKNGHGGNLLLAKLLKEDTQYPDAFLYSVLQVLPKSMARKDVIGWERVFKEKLGTRATGLNLN